ncbi:HNH endonuclease [Romboutsia hominis]|uniref:HNH endonuclease n=1 Tax=Romboutsia hominis TaxID=1507512 RepID=UPI001F06F10E|nr:HNH endonuclease [Romboutsia hominis]MCH1960058.1 HNH endonuclease [Romboutsia hominis]MCH1969513.1 HNH endonuclease [Romboutsia hominis]
MKIGRCYSWEIISENVIIKNTDKSVFKEQGSGVPKEIREFFKVQNITQKEKVFIKIVHNSKEYEAYIVMESNDLARTRMYWYKDLSKVLNSYLPNYESYFINNSSDNKSVPIMRFERKSDFTYKLDVIFEGQIEKDIFNEIEDMNYKTLHKEGNIKYQLSKKYERSPKNRLEAIKIHGTKCLICGFDFKEIYGDRGEGFIEIHHIIPLSELNEETEINPKKDLIPVCSNCHRMIHRERNNILSIDEMKSILNK